MVWYGPDIRKLVDGNWMVTGGGTEIRVSIPSHFDGNIIPTHYHRKAPRKFGKSKLVVSNIFGLPIFLVSVHLLAFFSCTGTAVLEFNYEGEARESFRTPSFWKQKRRAARFATPSSLFLTYLVVISSDFNTDFCVAHTAVRRW